MRRLVVYNNKIVINGYKYGDLPQIEKNFESFDRVTHTYNIKGMIIEGDQLILPKGIDIGYLENILDVKAFYEIEYPDPILNDDNILLRHSPKDDDQVKAINFMLGKNEYKKYKNVSHELLSLGTGKGKTYLGIAFISYTNMKSIIITTSNEWLTQWKVRIQEHTNIQKSEIHQIIGCSDIRNLLKKDRDKLAKKYKIYTVTHSTLLNYAKDNGWDSLDDIFRHLGIGVKIFDEAHLNFDNMYNIDFHTNVYKTLYLTATPERGDEQENKIFQLYFKNIPTLDINNSPHTQYIALQYESKLTAFEINKFMSINYGFNKNKYCNMVVYKRNFDYISRVVMELVLLIPGKKLFFFATNEAVMFFYQWLMEYYYIECMNEVGIYTSINPNKREALDKTFILTTSKSAGAALDCPGLMASINMAEPTKSPPQNKQRFGRTREYGSYYIDLVDMSVKTCSNYFKASLPMFEKEALKCSICSFNDNQLESKAFKIMEERKRTSVYEPFLRFTYDNTQQ